MSMSVKKVMVDAVVKKIFQEKLDAFHDAITQWDHSTVYVLLVLFLRLMGLLVKVTHI